MKDCMGEFMRKYGIMWNKRVYVIGVLWSAAMFQ